MSSERQLVLGWMFQQTFAQARVRFDTLLIAAAGQALDKSPPDAALYAEINANRLWSWMREQLDEEEGKGLSPTFLEIAEGTRELWWYPKRVTERTSRKKRHLKLRLQAKPELLSAIGEVSQRDYEALGCLACELNGATRVCLTRSTGEHGIDFLAVLPMAGRSHVFQGGAGPLRIVGQSKKNVTRKLEPKAIKELITTLLDIRHRSEDVQDIVPPWFYAAKGPLIGWIITHAGLGAGATTKADQQGIIHSDTRDIAEMIAKSRIWNPENGADHAVDAMQRAIGRILEEPSCGDDSGHGD